MVLHGSTEKLRRPHHSPYHTAYTFSNRVYPSWNPGVVLGHKFKTGLTVSSRGQEQSLIESLSRVTREIPENIR